MSADSLMRLIDEVHRRGVAICICAHCMGRVDPGATTTESRCDLHSIPAMFSNVQTAQVVSTRVAGAARLSQDARSLSMIINFDLPYAGIARTQYGSARDISGQTPNVATEPKLTRSQNNILLWRSYLPDGCVKSMIHMGWDRST